MKPAIFLTIGIFFSLLLRGQDQQKYSELTAVAWGLYEQGLYLGSAKAYSEAFEALGGKGFVNDRYNAACSWALAGEVDSAFVQLFKIANNGNYTNYGHITTDKDLNSLHEDPRWPEVTEIIRKNKEKEEEHLDKELVAMLDTIFEDDQKYRREIAEIEKKYGWESDEMQAQWKIISEKDSLNLIKIEKILEERGWLGPEIIGRRGGQTLFLVIQHADIEVQEKYLPMMREAVQKGNANAGSLALLEDRVALRQGKKQIYGSQIGRDPDTGEYYVLPLEDPDNVDKRRAEVGLGTMQSYVSNWGMTWNVEEYKKQLPEIEAKQKKQ